MFDPALQAVADFHKAKDSGAESDRLFAALVPLPSGDNAVPLRAALVAAPDLATALSDAGCSVPAIVETKVAAALVPLLAAAAQFGFEAWVANRKAEVEALLAAAKASYDAPLLIKDPAILSKSPCIALMRYGVAGQPADVIPGMIAVLKLRPVGGAPAGIQALQVEPTFVRAFNAVAITAAVEQPKVPLIDMAFAVSAQAIGNQDSGLPALLPAGAATVEVAHVGVGKEAKPACVAPPDGRPEDLAAAQLCARSDLLPYPIGKGPVVLRIGIAEAGKTGIPGARAIAALDALKAAFGPALSEAVKAHFGK